MDSVLQTVDISKHIKNKHIVSNVSINIEKGDIYGFIGENGAGKTTILRLVSGLIKRNSGTYRLFGIDASSKKIYTVKKRMSAIIEAPSLFMNLSAYNNLLIQCKILGIKDKTIIKDTLEMVGLGELYDDKKKVKNFSLGMRQRLGIAICLIGNPEFIMLDEPMNGLDPEGIIGVRNLILELNKEKNITFIISSHILSELSKVATKYGFIHKGVLLEELTQEELSNKTAKKVIIKYDGNLEENLLVDFGINKFEMIDDILTIYDEVDVIDFGVKLKEKNIKILKINQTEDDVEKYYLDLMGGIK